MKQTLKYSVVFLFFTLAVFAAALAQNLPAIQLDRPDQTECPFIVPAKYFQFENGINFEKISKNEKVIIHPATLWKYGINEKIELRIITEFITLKNTMSTITGLSPVTVGFKVNLTKEKGIIPITSFIGHLTIPGLAASQLKTTYFAPAFRFTMQHTLSDKISLSYNLGAEWDGETPEPTFIYTITTGFTLSEKIGAYIEAYGFAPQKSKAEHRCDGGFTYLLQQNMMLDISAGTGITTNAPDYYGSLGFSIRLPH